MNRRIFGVVVCATLAFAHHPALPQDLGAGESAYWMGNYEKAREIFRPLADSGVADAQHYLGLMHDKGPGVEQDPSEAA